MDIETLTKKLNIFTVPTGSWGKEGAKGKSDLLQEINSGECELIVNTETGELMRVVKAITIKVRYIDPINHQELQLVEDVQEFDDGRERRRKKDDSIAEKMKPGESPAKAVKRALQEELGMSIIGSQPVFIDEKIVEKESSSYPGLLTRYYLYQHDMLLNPEYFNPDGYIEEGPNLTTYFVWKEVSTSQND